MDRSSVCKSLTLFFFYSILCHLSAQSQRNENRIISILSEDKKEWQLSGTNSWLSPRCKGGEFLVFSTAPQLVAESKCNLQTGKFVTRSYSWKLKAIDRHNWSIMMGDSTYKLIINEAKAKITLILRSRASASEIDTFTNDKVYIYTKPVQ